MGGVGVLAGLVAGGYVWMLVKQAERNLWAISTIQRPGLAVALLTAQSDLRETRALGAAVGLFTSVAVALFLAGAVAIAQQPMVTVALLVSAEALVVLGLMSLVALGAIKHRDRSRMVQALRTASDKLAPGNT